MSSRQRRIIFLLLTAWFHASIFFDVLGLHGERHRRYDGFSALLMEKTISDRAPRHAFAPMLRADADAYYFSQFGLHGRALAWIDRVWPSSHTSLVTTTELLFSLALALLLAWFFVEALTHFSRSSVLLSALLLGASPWLVALGPHIYWALFLSFAPFVLAFTLYPRVLAGRVSWAAFSAVLGVACLLKALCGYEFLSTIMIAAGVAMLFHETQRRAPLGKRLLRLSVPCIAMFLGVFAALALHLAQLTALFGREGVDAFVGSATARTHGDGFRDLFLVHQSALLVSKLHVVNHSLGMIFDEKVFAVSYDLLSVLNLTRYFGSSAALWPGANVEDLTWDHARQLLSFAGVWWLSAFALATVWLRPRWFPNARHLKHAGIFAAVSAAAPMSWLLLARGHMHFHLHINCVLFFLPWTIFASLFIFEWTKDVAHLVLPRLIRTAYALRSELYQAIGRGVAIPRERGATAVWIATFALLAFAVKPVRHVELFAANLTDANWTAGISNHRAMVLVINSDALRSLTSDDSITLSSGERRIERIEASRVILEGPPIDAKTDGYPHVMVATPARTARRDVVAALFLVLAVTPLLLRLLPRRRRLMTLDALPVTTTTRLAAGMLAIAMIAPAAWSLLAPPPLRLAIAAEVFVTDEYWTKGVAKQWAGFFVPVTESTERMYRAGRWVRFADHTRRKITRVDRSTSYLNIYVEGAVLDPNAVGLPNTFLVFDR